MLRINQNSSAGGARSYYTRADYYTEGQELVGVWRGKGTERLGLRGSVEQSAWDALCENRNPDSGESLTLRQKADRRVGYDFNFHVPKSVSLLYSLSRDDRLLTAFQDSVRDTMVEVESEMQTRVRKAGRNEDRTTGNMVWGEFTHFTSRPIDGVPDPHLHAHCFVFNTTWDDKEHAWKAGQFQGLKRDAPYFEARFHSRLARRLGELGLEVTRTKSGWELVGLDKKSLDKFSRRTALIEDEARRQGILDPAEKAELGAKTRERKQKDLTLDELRTEWKSRLTDDERDQLDGLNSRIGTDSTRESPDIATAAVRQAIEHCFERHSVVPERKLFAEAAKRGVGQTSIASIERTLAYQQLINADRNGQRWVTTREILDEELRLLAFARNGRGTQRKLGQGTHSFQRDWLNADQRKAVEHLLESRDRVMLIRGAAGVGKTAMMQEAVEAITASGTKVFAFAPSADASRGTLRDAGFPQADTVARLLLDENLHREIQDSVLWIDEAGLLGTKTMGQLFDLANKLDARVILSGDRRQHGSVERGAALRLLEEEAGLVPAEIREIQRQRGDYKQAIHALSIGRTEEGFRTLDRLGWVREVPAEERYETLAADYVQSITSGKSALVVSPTHREGDLITAEIRDRLKRKDRIHGEEQILLQLDQLNLTQAERSEREHYLPGDVIEFHQNAKGHSKGQRITLELPTSGTQPPLDQASRFQAYRPKGLTVAAGDLIRITKNGTTLDGQHRLNNGALYSVKKFDERGHLVLENGWTVARDFGHIAHGYVVTSHASQGKTVDHVFLGESAMSFGAASREQFYVSASRGRERVTIYTDNKASLLDAIRHSDDRLSATELIRTTLSQPVARAPYRGPPRRPPARKRALDLPHTVHPPNPDRTLHHDR